MRRFVDPNFIPGADDDDQGQIDGDASSPVDFAQYKPGGAGQPWLRSPLPPWHLWGNSQLISTFIQSSAAPVRTATPGQLVKVSYNRPETWNWLFAARLVSGPDSPIVSTQISVAFDLSVGIGRSAIRMRSAGVFQDQPFEQFFFTWGPVSTLFPRDVQLYSTEVLAPNRVYRSDAPFPDQTGFPVPGAFVTGPSKIDHIVAQDVQLECRVIGLSAPGSATIGQEVVVEVSGQFAPSTHVRPDWYQDAPIEVVFAGSEVGGR